MKSLRPEDRDADVGHGKQPHRRKDAHVHGSPPTNMDPEQTGAFLDHIADDPLYALYHLIEASWVAGRCRQGVIC